MRVPGHEFISHGFDHWLSDFVSLPTQLNNQPVIQCTEYPGDGGLTVELDPFLYLRSTVDFTCV